MCNFLSQFITLDFLYSVMARITNSNFMHHSVVCSLIEHFNLSVLIFFVAICKLNFISVN